MKIFVAHAMKDRDLVESKLPGSSPCRDGKITSRRVGRRTDGHDQEDDDAGDYLDPQPRPQARLSHRARCVSVAI